MLCFARHSVRAKSSGVQVCNSATLPSKRGLRCLACVIVLAALAQWAPTSRASSPAWVPSSSLSVSARRSQALTRERHSGTPHHAVFLRRRGDTPPKLGALATDSLEASGKERSGLVLLWGALGVAAYLSYGVAKVVPIVLAGLASIETPLQWAFLVGTMLFFAYYEGYKGFQKGFSPRVVSRAWVVSEQVRAEVLDKELLRRYGIAYALTSILLSISSIPTCFYLVRHGVDVASLFARMGFQTSAMLRNLSVAALAYALWKTTSPFVFALTETITPLVARLLGVPEAKVETIPRTPMLHKILAPVFCIGYFHGSRKRVISSWALTTLLFLVVVGVKRLANPYRAIIDAGVIVGLSWGVVSILLFLVRSLQKGTPPSIDAGLPAGTVYTALL